MLALNRGHTDSVEDARLEVAECDGVCEATDTRRRLRVGEYEAVAVGAIVALYDTARSANSEGGGATVRQGTHRRGGETEGEEDEDRCGEASIKEQHMKKKCV